MRTCSEYGWCQGDSRYNASACDAMTETVCNIAHDFDNENWSDSDYNNWSFSNVESNTGNDNSRPGFVCAGHRMAGGYSYFGAGATATR
jgi:hypothetical protein